MFKKLLLSALIVVPATSQAGIIEKATEFGEKIQEVFTESTEALSQELSAYKTSMQDAVKQAREKITDKKKQIEFFDSFSEVPTIRIAIETKKTNTQETIPEKIKKQLKPYLDESQEELEKRYAAAKEKALELGESFKGAVRDYYASLDDFVTYEIAQLEKNKELSKQEFEQIQQALKEKMDELLA